MKADGLQPEAQLEEARQQHPQPSPAALAERDDHDVGEPELAELLLAAQARSSRRLRSGGRKKATDRITSRLTRFQRV